MKRCRLVVLLQVAALAATVQRGYTGKEVVSSGPAAVVRQLYDQVVMSHPLGIPHGNDKAALWPLLSKRLIRQLDTALACEDDYDRQQAGHDPYPNDPDHHLPPVILKPEFGWLESGLFSGENEMALPAVVDVERTRLQKNGAFRVYVRFMYKEYDRASDREKTFHWHGAAVVISEDRRFLVDDILLFKEESTKIESRLSRRFRGCNGPRWIGYQR
jgi:hypothetical protein